MSIAISSNAVAGANFQASKRSGVLSLTDKFVTALIFLYWLIYQNIFFFYPMEVGGTPLAVLTGAIKLLLPVFLLIFTGLPSLATLSRAPVGLYCLFFTAFMLWGAVPTLISGEVVEWLKILPRVLFFACLLAWFSHRPATFALFAKWMMLYVMSALAQYLLIYATGAHETAVFTGYAYMAGPWGLFGNMSSRFYLLDNSVPFLRLAGFWNEPTHAAACAFSGFFLGRYLILTGHKKYWRTVSYVCLIAGVLTLSLAGYLAIGSAIVFALMFESKRWTTWRVVRFSLLFPVAMLLFLIVVFGRTYVADNYPDNIWLRAIVGARDSNIQQASYDPTSGRMDIASGALDRATSTVVGVGIQPTGMSGISAPESAPLLWLLLTGIPGLILLLCREAALLLQGRAIARVDPAALSLVQALVAVMAQQLSHGDWMTPSYFVLAAMVLAFRPVTNVRLDDPNRHSNSDPKTT
jgi:hypothetical protein